MPESCIVNPQQIPPPTSFPSLTSYPRSVRRFFEDNRKASAAFVACAPERLHWLQRHTFRVSANVCIDGRVTDFWQAVGTPVGILEMYRSAGARNTQSDLSYNRRCLDGIRKAGCVTFPNGETKRMALMRFCTAHYSHTRPDDASCAYWKHNTKAAQAEMEMTAALLHRSFPGKLVAFPVLVDTDLDALILCGPRGHLGTRELLDDPRYANGNASFLINERLRDIFPLDWEPLARLERSFQEAFYPELAEYLNGNFSFVRKVIETKRPVELLDHQERLMVVGRHADWLTEHGGVFLIDDTDTDAQLLTGFEIGLKYVVKNVLSDAIQAQDREWMIPVIVNIPHDGDDADISKVYATCLVEEKLRRKLDACAGKIARWLQSRHGIRASAQKMPGWLQTQLPSLVERVQFFTSVSHRADRLFVPFTL